MSGFRSLDIRIDYSGPGHEILNDFVLPVLEESISYDRITSFFTTDSLVSIANGLNRLYEHRGVMRLVIGLHDVPIDLAAAAGADDALIAEVDRVRRRLLAELSKLSDELSRDRMATLAWMMRDGFLEVRVAAVVGAAPGIFHNKAMVFHDAVGAVIAAVGSPNETSRGLGGNFEHLTVFSSWDSRRYTDAQERFFEDLWAGTLDGVSLVHLDREFASEILESLGSEHARPTPPASEADAGLTLGDVVDAATSMPAFSLVSGNHTALYPHQERAYLDALSRWPVRALLADEVGLGKTFEAGAIISFMTRFSGVESVIILAPKAVVGQWQGELKDHFGVDSWVYDSGRRAYLSSEGSVRPLHYGESPVGPRRPQVCIISAQFARGQGAHIFDETAQMPDLLVVDEAHSARVRPDLSGAIKPTLMWRMLDEITRKIPHVIFATATPMQVHWREYHALLRLLGLPAAWRKPGNYEHSLRLVAQDQCPSSLNEGALAAHLILSSLAEMAPSFDRLSPDETAHIASLESVQADTADLAECALRSWELTRSCLVRLHPAQLLTVRNTRGSLEKVGYKFPERILDAPALRVPPEIRTFYLDIDDYLSSSYFEVERALYPNRKFNVGFVKCGYQQRLASSLAACQLSLQRRRAGLEQLTQSMVGLTEFLGLTLDQAEDPEIVDESLPNLTPPEEGTFDSVEVGRRARVEAQYIDGLLGRLHAILDGGPDPKLEETVSIVRRAIERGDQVLVFSRYTDTLEAVVDSFLMSGPSAGYGVFTGERASLDIGTGVVSADRLTIRQALASGAARVIFCSDAASEGLNLQSARVLINVDVPWNPARLEQRIGRIARLGQKASTVEIFNIWYPDSIEARMYQRLHARKELYELAVGEFPDVIGDSIRAEVATRLGDPRTADDPIAQLKRLRNESQVTALTRLWSREVPSQTMTGRFRESLAQLLCTLAQARGQECSGQDGSYYLVANGKRMALEVEPGSNGVASLQCEAVDSFRSESAPHAGDISIALTSEESPAALAAGPGPGDLVRPVDLPALLRRILGITPDAPLGAGDERPLWLPSPVALTIPLEGECVVEPAPAYWPPVSRRPLVRTD